MNKETSISKDDLIVRESYFSAQENTQKAWDNMEGPNGMSNYTHHKGYEDAVRDLAEKLGVDLTPDEKYPVDYKTCSGCTCCCLVTRDLNFDYLCEDKQYYQCIADAETLCSEKNKDNICRGIYGSVYDYGASYVETPCLVDLSTGRVFDIKCIDVPNVDRLDEEYIELGDKRYPIGKKESRFWIEGGNVE